MSHFLHPTSSAGEYSTGTINSDTTISLPANVLIERILIKETASASIGDTNAHSRLRIDTTGYSPSDIVLISSTSPIVADYYSAHFPAAAYFTSAVTVRIASDPGSSSNWSGTGTVEIIFVIRNV